MKKTLSALLALLLTGTLLSACAPTPSKPQGSEGQDDPTDPAPAFTVKKDEAPEGRLFVGATAEGLEFGVVGDVCLFEPGTDIPFFVRTTDGRYAGRTVTAVFPDGKECAFALDDGAHLYTFAWSSTQNGAFLVKFSVENETVMPFFHVGVMPRVERASDEFFYGVQAYFNRLYEWIPASLIEGTDQETTLDIYLKTMEYLGINTVRDDNPTWGVLQKGPDKKINFTEFDSIVEKITGRGLYYNIILGYNGGKWTVKKELVDRYDDDDHRFAFCPEPEIWDTYVAALAQRYASDNHILWEIWNEPNWEYFVGTRDDYFSLLERTATILRKANPEAFIYSGGLAVADRSEYLVYYQKAKELMEQGLLDTFGYHIHETFDLYFDAMSRIRSLVDKAGLSGAGGMNSESGVWGADAATIACKALYTRSGGDRGFVAYTLSASTNWAEEVNRYSLFSARLCPKTSAIAYGTVIRFLGNAHFVSCDKDTVGAVLDRYTNADGKTVKVLYAKKAVGDAVEMDAGTFTVYDMLGNPVDVEEGQTIFTAKKEPLYFIYD